MVKGRENDSLFSCVDMNSKSETQPFICNLFISKKALLLLNNTKHGNTTTSLVAIEGTFQTNIFYILRLVYSIQSSSILQHSSYKLMHCWHFGTFNTDSTSFQR